MSTDNEIPRLLRVSQVVKHFGFSPQFWNDLYDRKVLAQSTIAKQRVFDRDNIVAFIESSQKPAASEQLVGR